MATHSTFTLEPANGTQTANRSNTAPASRDPETSAGQAPTSSHADDKSKCMPRNVK